MSADTAPPPRDGAGAGAESVYASNAELSAAPEGTDLLRLPFDMYQRYALTAELLSALVPTGGRLLEVGAAPSPAEGFFGDYQLVLTDRYGTKSGRYVVSDGAALPFATGAFDAVITLDTLEHVVAGDRPAFLRECRRVSRDLVLLTAPFASAAVELAEDALHSFVRARLHQEFPTLAEHRDRGLPLLEETVSALGSDGWSATALPSGYLPRWLMGMVLHHELLAAGADEVWDLHAFYNATMSRRDARSPAYRQLVLGSAVRPREELEQAVSRLRAPEGDDPAAAASLAGIASFVLAQRLTGSRTDAAQLIEQATTLERVVADREAHLVDLRGQLAAVSAQLAAEQARTVQLTARVAAAEAQAAAVQELSLTHRARRAADRLHGRR